MKRIKKPTNHIYEFWRDITTFGGFTFYTIIFVITFLTAQISLFWQLLFGLLFTGFVVVIIRKIYPKQRPAPQTYSNEIEKIDASSFPSWHTARVTYLCLSFSFFFNKTFLSVIFILLTITTAYSRIYLKKHDWIDLLGGFALGLITFAIAMYMMGISSWYRGL